MHACNKSHGYYNSVRKKANRLYCIICNKIPQTNIRAKEFFLLRSYHVCIPCTKSISIIILIFQWFWDLPFRSCSIQKFRLLNDVACEKLESWNDIFVSNLNWFYVNFVSENEKKKKKKKTKWDFLFPFIVTCKAKLIAITAPKYIQPCWVCVCSCAKVTKMKITGGKTNFFRHKMRRTEKKEIYRIFMSQILNRTTHQQFISLSPLSYWVFRLEFLLIKLIRILAMCLCVVRAWCFYFISSFFRRIFSIRKTLSWIAEKIVPN